jgi:hypothetical protein
MNHLRKAKFFRCAFDNLPEGSCMGEAFLFVSPLVCVPPSDLRNPLQKPKPLGIKKTQKIFNPTRNTAKRAAAVERQLARESEANAPDGEGSQVALEERRARPVTQIHLDNPLEGEAAEPDKHTDTRIGSNVEQYEAYGESETVATERARRSVERSPSD